MKWGKVVGDLVLNAQILRFDQISNDSPRRTGKIQFLPPCIWNLSFMSYRLSRSLVGLGGGGGGGGFVNIKNKAPKNKIKK